MYRDEKAQLSEEEQSALSRAFSQYQQDDRAAFTEVIVKQKRQPLDYAKTAGILLFFLTLTFISAFTPLARYTMYILPFIIAGGAALSWWVITSTSREFEYVVVRGDLDVDQITAQRRRKRVFSVLAKDIELMAACRSDEYRSISQQNLRLLDLSADAKNPDNWFIVAHYEGSRVLALLSPAEKVIRAIHHYAPSKVRYQRPAQMEVS